MSKNKKNKESTSKEFLPCEWVVQFDDDPPQRLAYVDENSEVKDVIIKLSNNEESYINFTDTKTNKSFKIFARKPLL